MTGPLSPFRKPATAIADQLAILKNRGMTIADDARAAQYLATIGYYRLTGYCLPFKAPSGNFVPGADFDTVVQWYEFDRELRLLVLAAVERIEVAFRTGISNYMSLVDNPHWYMDSRHFDSSYDHRRLIDEVKAATSYTAATGSLAHKKRDLFIQHYYGRYDDPILPPSWMIAEVLPMGAWSIAYAHLMDIHHRKQISKPFGLHHEFLGPWLHTLTYLRNLCAHHSRVWDRTMTLKPRVAKVLAHLMTPNDRFAAQAVMIWHLLKHVDPGSDWNDRLKQLIAKYPAVNNGRMGFSSSWATDPFWV